MRRVFFLPLCPRAIDILLLGIPSILENSLIHSSLAFPSTGGELRKTFTEPAGSTVTALREDLGDTMMSIKKPSIIVQGSALPVMTALLKKIKNTSLKKRKRKELLEFFPLSLLHSERIPMVHLCTEINTPEGDVEEALELWFP